jgi:hypothetical protein
MYSLVLFVAYFSTVEVPEKPEDKTERLPYNSKTLHGLYEKKPLSLNGFVLQTG